MANNRLAYGLAKAHGIDTIGMSPKEVWEALEGKGITPENAQKQLQKVEEHKREEIRKKFADSDNINSNAEVIIFERVRPNKFHESLQNAKDTIPLDRRWRVTLHDEVDYAKDKLFVTKGGSCVAVTPDGDIISVCKNDNSGERGVAKKLLKKAVKEGGTKLDAYGEDLFKTYTKNGFEPVSWVEWNEEYAPDEWKEAKKQGLKANPEPVIFYKHTGREEAEINMAYKEFLKITPFSSDYYGASQIRDKEIGKWKK